MESVVKINSKVVPAGGGNQSVLDQCASCSIAEHTTSKDKNTKTENISLRKQLESLEADGKK